MRSKERPFIRWLIVLSVLGTGRVAAEPFVYVTQLGGSSVTVIDAATNAVVDTIPVGGGPRDVALSPTGTRAYVATALSVSVVDTATNDFVATIPSAPIPGSIVVSPDGTRAYATSNSGIPTDISVIDLVTNSVASTIFYGSIITYGLDILPDGSRVYAAPLDSGSVLTIDTSTDSVIDELYLDPYGQTFDLVVTPDGTRAYLSRQVAGSGWLTIIDTATNSQIGQFSVGSLPWGLALGPDGTRLYMAGIETGTVFVIDTTTNQVIGEPIDVGGSPRNLAVTPNETRLFVTDDENDRVSVIDLVTNSMVGTLDLPEAPYGIVIGPAPAVTAMAIDPNDPMTVYAGTAGGGVYRTLDGGTSWAAVNAGIADLHIVALVIATDGSAIYAGTRAGGVFRSTDGGASWTAVNDGLDPHILTLEIAPGNGMILYASVDGGGGLYRTMDGGDTWTVVNDGLPAETP